MQIEDTQYYLPGFGRRLQRGYSKTIIGFQRYQSRHGIIIAT